MTFGERLKKARKEKKLTQRELATLIGAKNNSVSNWEKDQNRPNGSTILMLTQVLDISPLYLIGEYTLNDVCMLEDKDPTLLTDDDRMAIDFFKAQSVDFGNFISEASEDFNKGNGIEDIKLIYQLILNNKGKIYLIEQLILLLNAPVFLEDYNLSDKFDADSIKLHINKLIKVKDEIDKEGGE